MTSIRLSALAIIIISTSIVFGVLIIGSGCNSMTSGRHLLKGRHHIQDGQFELALEECNAAIATTPEKASAYQCRGRAYLELKEYDKSLTDYNKAIELDPLLAELFLGRGVVYYGLQEYDEAINDFNKFDQLIEAEYSELDIESDPREIVINTKSYYSPWAYYYRGLIYLHQKLYEKAVFEFNELLSMKDIGKVRCHTYFYLGQGYKNMDNKSKAIKAYRQFIKCANSDDEQLPVAKQQLLGLDR